MSALALHTKSVEPRSAVILPAGSAASCRRKRGAARGAAGCRPASRLEGGAPSELWLPTLYAKPSALSPGTRLGPYEVVSLIGAGGMGLRTNFTSTDRKRLSVPAHKPSV